MNMLDKLWSALRSDPDFAGMTDEQNAAVVDALVGAIFGDARLVASEAREFDSQIEKLPWRWAQDARARERVIAASREKVDRLAEPGALQALAASIAERLPQLAVRAKVLQMCVAICLADRVVDDAETKFLVALRDAFGLPKG